MKNKKKIYYDWEQFEDDIKALAEACSQFYFKNIYGVPRGGLIPAIMLSNLLEFPLILDESDISKETLIIDDISDSGQTLIKLKKKHKKFAAVMTLWIENNTKAIPNVWCQAKIKNQWVVFPWEQKI